jgi:GTP cyclohydrolase IA
MKIEKLTLMVRGVLEEVGLNVNQEDTLDTPRRYAKFLLEFNQKPEFRFTTFAANGVSEMVWQRKIPWFSLCRHHTLPMFGYATVAYLPNQRLAGLSKLARAVQYCAQGFQTQENITREIAEMLQGTLNPLGVGVKLTGTHLCMVMRGVKAMGTETTTSCLLGHIRDLPSSRQEFLSQAG